MQRIAITYGARTGFLCLRELRGADEEAIRDVDTWSAIGLVDRLLVDAPGVAVRPGEAAALTAADRDRVLAALHARELGDRIASTATCPACDARFDLDFHLSALLDGLVPDRAGVIADDAGGFTLADGTRFRVPTGQDELEAAAAPAPGEALIRRCRLAGDGDPAEVAEALERIAPLLDLELDAACPECGHVHAVRFDMQRFLLGRLLAESQQRTAEIHRLARGYGWSLSEILSLPRARRREHVDLIEREMGVR